MLMDDGIHYKTLREDICFSNIGPGYYNATDNWSPTAFVKYNKNRRLSPTAQVEDSIVGTLNISTRSRGKAHDSKPWRQNSVAGGSSLSPVKNNKPCTGIDMVDPLLPGGPDPFDTADVDARIRAAKNRHEESKRDIHSVMNLPNYFQ